MANGEAGRPEIELTEDQIKEVETLAAVLSTGDIADYFGIGRTTFYALMERNPDISERYKKGRAKAKGAIAGSLIQKARSGELGAQIFYLKTQCGYTETQRIETDINVQHVISSKPLTANEWAIEHTGEPLEVDYEEIKDDE